MKRGAGELALKRVLWDCLACSGSATRPTSFKPPCGCPHGSPVGAKVMLMLESCDHSLKDWCDGQRFDTATGADYILECLRCAAVFGGDPALDGVFEATEPRAC